MNKNIIKTAKYAYIIFICFLTLCVYIYIFSDGYEDLGDGYAVELDEYQVCKKEGDDMLVILPDWIKEIQHDNRFIIAKQRPDEWVVKNTTYNYPLGPDTIYYWIIDKQCDKQYGPMCMDEFVHTRDSLCITINFKEKSKK